MLGLFAVCEVTARRSPIAAPAGGLFLLRNPKLWALLAFAVCLSLASLRAYRYPEYTTDGFSYMANAVAMKGESIQVIHDSVYREAMAGIPRPIFDHLTGNDPTEPVSQSRSFQERARDAYRFAEFLPCFAIRPIFNELIYVLHYKLGIGLLKASVLIPVVSYWLMGWMILAWIWRYAARPWAALIAILLLLSPPLWDLARSTTPDALSTLILLAAMFLLLEKRRLLPGLILLMASVYVRTDNVLIVLAVLAYLYVAGYGLRASQAVVLSAVAVASVFVINHFAGDYGARMLYYRSFVGTPLAIGELVPRVGFRDYLAGLKSGISGLVHGSYIAFTLMGIVGVLRRPSYGIVGLAAVTGAYAAAHFILLPNPETRYFGPFFAGMGIVLASTLSAAQPIPLWNHFVTRFRERAGAANA